ncbi:carbohydrate kinase family protein [Candidatus Woesearchaeota archaeon]|nr:carbohydrate kinase family protein [Candidatus Woesearchaeota archaeon]
MYDVITVGSSTFDVFARAERSELIKILGTSKLEEEFLAYRSGTKILISELMFSIGGGGTNTAVCLSRLGCKAAYLGKVGLDENGERILKILKRDNVSFVGARSKIMSGYSIILESIEHDRTILTYKGCNDELGVRDVNFGKLKAKWMYFSSMMGESFKTLEKIAKFAHDKKIRVCFNPSSYLAEKGASYLESILKYTTLLVLNREEAQYLVGRDDMNLLLKRLNRLVPLVVITDGKKGAHATDGKFNYYAHTLKMEPIDSTGAGDCFASTFLSGLIKQKPIQVALKMATINAMSVLTAYGAKNGLLKYDELLRRMRTTQLRVVSERI